MIKGLKTNLVAFEASHWPFILKWTSDPDYRYYFRNIPQIMNVTQASSFPTLLDMNVLLVTENVTNQIIGMATWDNIRIVGRSCQMGFLVDKDYQGNGYTKDAFMHFMWYLIGRLGFHKVIANVATEEKDTIEKSIWGGFRVETPIMLDEFYMDGEWKPETRLVVIDHEFKDRFKKYTEREKSWVEEKVVPKVHLIKKS